MLCAFSTPPGIPFLGPQFTLILETMLNQKLITLLLLPAVPQA